MIEPITYNDFNPSTITMKCNFFDKEGKKIILSEPLLAEFLPVKYPIDPEVDYIFPNDYRFKFKSQESEDKIIFYKENDVVVNISGKNIKRGIRFKAMKNMTSFDYQVDEKNIHIKLTNSGVNLLGLKSLESAESVILQLTNKIIKFQKLIEKIQNLNYSEFKKIKNYVLKESESNHLLRWWCDPDLLKQLDKLDYYNKNFDIYELLFYYATDFGRNEYQRFHDKIEKFEEIFIRKKSLIYRGELVPADKKYFDISNAVHNIHITLEKKLFTEKENFINLENNLGSSKISKVKFALFLNKLGAKAVFYNWGLNFIDLRFPVEGKNYYFHTFAIYSNGTVRQTSPTTKDIYYKYYLALIELINEYYKKGYDKMRISELTKMLDN